MKDIFSKYEKYTEKAKRQSHKSKTEFSLDKMKEEIDDFKIEVSGELNPERFLGSSDKERAGFKSITLNLVPETDASIETLTKWLQIVEERCPVKDNLQNNTPVKIAVEKEYNTI